MSTFQPRFRNDTVSAFLANQQDQVANQRATALQSIPEWMRLSFQNQGLGAINAAAHQYGQATMNAPRYGPNMGGASPTRAQYNPNPMYNPNPIPRPGGLSFNQSPSFGVADRLRSTFGRRSAYTGY